MNTTSRFPWKQCSDFVLSCGYRHEPYGFCEAVLESINDLIPYDQALFLMLDGNRKVARQKFVHIPEHWSLIYLGYYAPLSSTDYSLDGDTVEAEPGGRVDLTDWVSRYGLHDDFITSYIKPRGLSQTLSITLFDLYGSPATIFCFDRLHGASFTKREVGIAEVLAPHLGNLYKNLFVRPQGQVSIRNGMEGLEKLTQREREVLDLLCQGTKPAYIARELHISLRTTNKHIEHIYRKLGVGSKQELLVRLLGR